MTTTPGTRRWLYGVSACLLLLIAGAAALYENPFWLIDSGVNTYLRANGVARRSVLVDGNRIEYLEAGGAGNQRPPLVLVHGLGARALDWAPLMVPLAKHGYHVYALDLLGYGGSAKPADSDFSLRTEEGVVSGFLQAVHLRQADVAGWSMGGWIAMLLALDHPDEVRRLVLLDSAGLFFDPDFDLSLFVPVDRAGLDRLVTRLEPDKPNLKIPGWAAHGMLRRLQANRWIIERSFRSMISGRSVLDFRLGQLRQPVLLVWGTEDKLTTFDKAERLHVLLPHSALYGLTGCGHLAAAECAGTVAPLMANFLSGALPSQPGVVLVDGKAKKH